MLLPAPHTLSAGLTTTWWPCQGRQPRWRCTLNHNRLLDSSDHSIKGSAAYDDLRSFACSTAHQGGQQPTSPTKHHWKPKHSRVLEITHLERRSDSPMVAVSSPSITMAPPLGSTILNSASINVLLPHPVARTEGEGGTRWRRQVESGMLC